jgi:hypothetical protein
VKSWFFLVIQKKRRQLVYQSGRTNTNLTRATHQTFRSFSEALHSQADSSLPMKGSIPCPTTVCRLLRACRLPSFPSHAQNGCFHSAVYLHNCGHVWSRRSREPEWEAQRNGCTHTTQLAALQWNLSLPADFTPSESNTSGCTVESGRGQDAGSRCPWTRHGWSVEPAQPDRHLHLPIGNYFPLI